MIKDKTNEQIINLMISKRIKPSKAVKMLSISDADLASVILSSPRREEYYKAISSGAVKKDRLKSASSILESANPKPACATLEPVKTEAAASALEPVKPESAASALETVKSARTEIKETDERSLPSATIVHDEGGSWVCHDSVSTPPMWIDDKERQSQMGGDDRLRDQSNPSLSEGEHRKDTSKEKKDYFIAKYRVKLQKTEKVSPFKEMDDKIREEFIKKTTGLFEARRKEEEEINLSESLKKINVEEENTRNEIADINLRISVLQDSLSKKKERIASLHAEKKSTIEEIRKSRKMSGLLK